MDELQQRANLRLVELFGADFDSIDEKLDELEAGVEKDSTELDALQQRIDAIPKATVEGPVPTLEEIQEALEEKKRKERERSRQLQKRQQQRDEPRRATRRRAVFKPQPVQAKTEEKDDEVDFGMEL